MILCIKADSKDVFLGLWDGAWLTEKSWEAGRELSGQILSEIHSMLEETQKDDDTLDAIIVYEGPGSYTGLRISISVANTIGYARNIPVVGSTGEKWVEVGLEKLSTEGGFTPLAPVYGGEVFTTKPRK